MSYYLRHSANKSLAIRKGLFTIKSCTKVLGASAVHRSKASVQHLPEECLVFSLVAVIKFSYQGRTLIKELTYYWNDENFKLKKAYVINIVVARWGCVTSRPPYPFDCTFGIPFVVVLLYFLNGKIFNFAINRHLAQFFVENKSF